MPLVTISESGTKSVRGLVSVIIPITVFLDTLFADKIKVLNGRSMDQEQFQIYKSIEGALQVAGVDGKACLLRTICEMQTNDFGKYSLIGELAAVLLTPKKGGFSNFLREYQEAQYVGQSHNMTCVDSFPRCPISLFELFQSYSAAGQSTEQGEQQVVKKVTIIPEPFANSNRDQSSIEDAFLAHARTMDPLERENLIV